MCERDYLSIFLRPSSCRSVLCSFSFVLFIASLFYVISLFLSFFPDLSLLLTKKTTHTHKKPQQSLSGAAQQYVCTSRDVIDHGINHRGKVSRPPQRSEQTGSAGAGTHTHVWIFGTRFWWHRAQLSLPYNTAVFYSQLPSGCYMRFRSCVPVNPPPVLTLTGRRCRWALNGTAQVNLCPAVTASIEGCFSTRILN